MNTPTICPQCGRLLPSPDSECASCQRTREAWFRRQSVIVLVLVVLAVFFFVITLAVTRAYESQRHKLAAEWFGRGEHDVLSGKPDAAIEEYQTALSYSEDNSEYRLRLAQALAAANHTNEALSYFLTLWEPEPGSGLLNLEIARLEARKGNFLEAMRYFHGAIDGIWDQDQQEHRLQARLEFVDFLLDNHDNTRAQAELIAAIPELPKDTRMEARIAGLFFQAGNYQRALELAREALHLDVHNIQAAAVAGQAAFHLHEYKAAVPYLKSATAADAQDAQSAQMLRTAELVLSEDPFLPGLASAERARRVLHDFEQAGSRLEQCADLKQIALGPNAPADSPLEPQYEAWKKLQPEATERRLRSDADLRESVMSTVFAAEQAAQQVCG